MCFFLSFFFLTFSSPAKFESELDKEERRAALREVSKMAVMKTCCGCLSTRSGTMTIFMLTSVRVPQFVGSLFSNIGGYGVVLIVFFMY